MPRRTPSVLVVALAIAGATGTAHGQTLAAERPADVAAIRAHIENGWQLAATGK